MGVQIISHVDECRKQLRAASIKGVELAGLKVREAMQDVVGRPNTGVSVQRQRDTAAGKKGSSYTIYPNPSKPGEPPKVRSSYGQANIFNRMFPGEAKVKIGVGENAIYMAYLEFQNRPWLVSTLLARRELAQRAFEVGFKSVIGSK